MAEKQQRGLELKGEADRHESRIQFNEERLRELAAQNAKALAEITQAEERCHAASAELQAVKERLAASENALSQHRLALEEKQRTLNTVENDLRQRQEALRRAQTEAFSAAQDLTRIRNEITALDLQKQGNSIRLEKLSAEKVQLEEERTRLETRLQEFTASVEVEKLNAQTKRGSVEQRQNRLRELQVELQAAAVEQDQFLQAQAEKRSRLNVLEQLEGSHEGFSAGTQAALRQSLRVIGSLADRIRVPDSYVVAIENALGHHLQLVLTEQPESAQEIIADLTANKSGRASVAALSLEYTNDKQLAFEGEMAPGSGLDAIQNGLQQGQVIHALSVVQAEPSVEKLLKALLGRTFIASDLTTATAQIQNGHAGCDFVTLTGDLLSRHGIYTGGYLNGNGNPKGPASILGRKNQISELHGELTEVQIRVADMSRKRGALLGEQTKLQASLQQAQTELREQEVAIATREGEFNALQNSNRLLHQKIETVVFEIQSLAAQELEGSQKRNALTARLNELEARERAGQEQVAALTAELENLRQQRDAAHAALTESKVALAAEEQLLASFRQQQQSLEQRIRELTQAVEQRRNEVSSFIGRKEQAESEIQDSRSQIERLQHERDQVGALTAELLARKQSQEADVAVREEKLREHAAG